MAKILTVSRKSHHPIETLLLLQYYSAPIILKCDLFGFDRVALKNEIFLNLEKSGNANINTKFKRETSLSSLQLLVIFFEYNEEP